ncbi:hypothetical protein J3B02_002496 [Coemansia erecta]|uniref:Cytochrome c oxidase assembly protein n=1 Tax=Coemansia asiatica TaxID=1052880 RepID=A0A9W7XN59_9FUNG|nr:hypothetical protein LPJ64_002690 [Coemansia asiatica]KAJ2854801.1 hypothetical protein J3B02_002496 [Coemansia erecta]
MSKAAKLTFLGSCVFAVGTIWFVHKAQEIERESMYQGVLRDQERKAQRERNTREFDETRALHAELIKQQPNVREGSNGSNKTAS